MTTAPSTGKFHSLQNVRVCDDEAMGYVSSLRQNCVGMEYRVVFWRGGRRDEAWFAESELEAA